jgi:hypothetical protein
VLTLLALLTAFAAPALVLGGIFALPGWVATAGEARRRRRRQRGGAVVVTGPPIERLAADLRRLRAQGGGQGHSRIQREGVRLAYEDVLRETALALGIPHDPPVGRFAREVEFLRLEQAIADSGVVLKAA